VTFFAGELFERSYETAAGVVEVLAEIMVDGRRLELHDIAIYPRGSAQIEVPVDTLMTWLRELAAEVHGAGFDELRITGTRLSGARTGRRVDLTIRLHEEHP
jgi:hypothetical protein